MIQKFLTAVFRHKVISLALLIALAAGGYYAYGKFAGSETGNGYILTAARRGTLVQTVGGTGQVSALNQIDLKPKASGEIDYIGVKEGQTVGAGALILRLDTAEAEKAVRDAEVNLESAKLGLEKLKQSTADTAKIMEDAFADISNAFLDFPTVVASAEEIILGSTLNPKNQDNIGFYKDFVGQLDNENYLKVLVFVDSAASDYNTARKDYDAAFLAYKNASRYSDPETIRALLEQTLAAARSLAQALKSEQNLLDFLSDYASSRSKTLPFLINTYKSNLRTYIGQVNTRLADLIGAENDIKNAPLDIRSQELAVKQRENALLDAKEALDNYYLRAPFAGVVANLNVKIGETVSQGTAAGILITAEKLAEVSLNEVDVAKVKTGENATLAFDAFPDLKIAGKVAEIDTVGTVSQGVVTYNVKIAFQTQDERVKPSMTVSAEIITDRKENVLLVPNAAVKYQGNSRYVEVAGVASGEPARRTVETGLSNDEFTEIISGLEEGEKVVVGSGTTANANGTSGAAGTQTRGLFFGGGGGGGGGGTRIGH